MKKSLSIVLLTGTFMVCAVGSSWGHSGWGMNNLPDNAIEYGEANPDDIRANAACCFCHFRFDVGPSNSCPDDEITWPLDQGPSEDN